MSIRKWWRILLAIPVLVYVTFYSTAIAHADAVSDAHKAIQAQYDRANLATSKRDAAGSYSIFSPGFVSVDKNGKKHTLADIKRDTQALFNISRIITGTTKIQSLTLKGNTALVRVSEHSKLIGTDPSTNTDSIIVIDSISDDVWVLTNGRWLETKSKTRMAKPSLNGRPYE